jgi:tryptophan 7-halogenase
MSTPPASAAPIGHILVCGHGLAAQMTAATLARQLPPAMRITLVLVADEPGSDLFYGTVTAPTAYAFNLAAGVEEPALVLRSETAFSWGTRYTGWGVSERSWIQCFNLPFPIVDGVLFHHYLAAAGIDAIEPFLVAAMAARRRAFAHPPRGPGDTGQHPLARADYGYQFDPAGYASLFAAAIPPGRVTIIHGTLAAVESGPDGIAGLRLDDGELLSADLYVDCTGPAAVLLACLAPEIAGDRRIGIAASREAPVRPSPPLRTVEATRFGWTATTPLRGVLLRTSAYDPVEADAAAATHPGGIALSSEARLGWRREAWAGNCVGIGHAAGVVEPLSPAPLMLLERDVERLLSLIPNAGGMAVERREYNRRFGDDHLHASLFNRALIETDGVADTRYWRAARADPLPEKLARKLALFASRGFLVAYDLEPFHPEDWTILHLGMGRRPARHDRLADRAPPARVEQFLADMRRGIEQVAAALPSSDTYRAQLETYLQRKQR